MDLNWTQIHIIHQSLRTRVLLGFVLWINSKLSSGTFSPLCFLKSNKEPNGVHQTCVMAASPHTIKLKSKWFFIRKKYSDDSTDTFLLVESRNFEFCIREKSLLLPLNFGFCYTTQDRQAQTPTRVGGLKSSWVLVDFQSSPFCGKTMGSKHNLSRITNHKKSYISPKKTAVWNRPLMNLAHFFLGLHIMKLEVHVCSQPLTLLALF